MRQHWYVHMYLSGWVGKLDLPLLLIEDMQKSVTCVYEKIQVDWKNRYDVEEKLICEI